MTRKRQLKPVRCPMFSANDYASDRVAFSQAPTDGAADAEAGEEDSKPEETADASPSSPPTKSKNKKNKNK